MNNKLFFMSLAIVAFDINNVSASDIKTNNPICPVNEYQNINVTNPTYPQQQMHSNSLVMTLQNTNKKRSICCKNSEETDECCAHSICIAGQLGLCTTALVINNCWPGLAGFCCCAAHWCTCEKE